MAIQMSRVRESVGEKELMAAETELGLQFPLDYRQFILMYNGGRPKPNGFVIHGETANSRSLVSFFFCIKPGDVYDIVKYCKRLKDRIPGDLLPIATDPFGNIICLSIAGEAIGRVYFWDHEDEAEESEEPRYKNVYLIADRLLEFIDGLVDFD